MLKILDAERSKVASRPSSATQVGHGPVGNTLIENLLEERERNVAITVLCLATSLKWSHVDLVICGHRMIALYSSNMG